MLKGSHHASNAWMRQFVRSPVPILPNIAHVRPKITPDSRCCLSNGWMQSGQFAATVGETEKRFMRLIWAMSTQADTKAVQATTAHRPWPMPRRPWIMAQVWHDEFFAHWPLEPRDVQPFIPQPLILDTFQSQAWLTITPFTVTGARPRGLPAVPLVSRFLQMNVRIYVTFQDKPGVLFLNLDASNPLTAAVARTLYHLPYAGAKMRCVRAGPAFDFTSRQGERVFHARYRPVGVPFAAAPGTLDHWLLERYCLYTTNARGKLYRGDIHHPPWPLQQAQAEIFENTSAPFPLPSQPAVTHYVARQAAIIWALVAAAHDQPL